MFQKDYVKRSFSFIQATLARLRAVAEEGDADVAREEITNAYSQVFGIPLSLLSLSPVSDIVDLLSTREGEDGERILSLAQLLKMDGEAWRDVGEVEEAQWRFTLALELLIASDEVPDPPPSMTAAVTFEPVVRDSLQHPLSLELLAALYGFYRRHGNDGLAKDLLLAFIETEGGRSEGIEEGIAYLSELQGRSDEALEQGNITRQEIDEALDNLRGSGA